MLVAKLAKRSVMPSPSLRTIAKELGISVSYISLMIGGKRPWRRDLLQQYNQLVNTVDNPMPNGELVNRGLEPDLATNGAWPSGRAPGLGPGGRQFESAHPDQI